MVCENIVILYIGLSAETKVQNFDNQPGHAWGWLSQQYPILIIYINEVAFKNN